MGYKLNKEDENPLWRNYMDNINDDIRWMKLVKLDFPSNTINHATYSEEEFEEMLLNDSIFKQKWGKL